MSETVQWTLVALAAIGAAGTWVRAYVAWRQWRDYR